MTDPSLPMKTAVIIEDDPDIRHLIVEVLEAAGFSTVSVGNGIDGVRACSPTSLSSPRSM
jgi:CheY-like chemotaxis protein